MASAKDTKGDYNRAKDLKGEPFNEGTLRIFRMSMIKIGGLGDKANKEHSESHRKHPEDDKPSKPSEGLDLENDKASKTPQEPCQVEQRTTSTSPVPDAKPSEPVVSSISKGNSFLENKVSECLKVQSASAGVESKPVNPCRHGEHSRPLPRRSNMQRPRYDRHYYGRNWRPLNNNSIERMNTNEKGSKNDEKPNTYTSLAAKYRGSFSRVDSTVSGVGRGSLKNIKPHSPSDVKPILDGDKNISRPSKLTAHVQPSSCTYTDEDWSCDLIDTSVDSTNHSMDSSGTASDLAQSSPCQSSKISHDAVSEECSCDKDTSSPMDILLLDSVAANTSCSDEQDSKQCSLAYTAESQQPSEVKLLVVDKEDWSSDTSSSERTFKAGIGFISRLSKEKMVTCAEDWTEELDASAQDEDKAIHEGNMEDILNEKCDTVVGESDSGFLDVTVHSNLDVEDKSEQSVEGNVEGLDYSGKSEVKLNSVQSTVKHLTLPLLSPTMSRDMVGEAGKEDGLTLPREAEDMVCLEGEQLSRPNNSTEPSILKVKNCNSEVVRVDSTITNISVCRDQLHIEANDNEIQQSDKNQISVESSEKLETKKTPNKLLDSSQKVTEGKLHEIPCRNDQHLKDTVKLYDEQNIAEEKGSLHVDFGKSERKMESVEGYEGNGTENELQLGTDTVSWCDVKSVKVLSIEANYAESAASCSINTEGLKGVSDHSSKTDQPVDVDALSLKSDVSTASFYTPDQDFSFSEQDIETDPKSPCKTSKSKLDENMNNIEETFTNAKPKSETMSLIESTSESSKQVVICEEQCLKKTTSKAGCQRTSGMIETDFSGEISELSGKGNDNIQSNMDEKCNIQEPNAEEVCATAEDSVSSIRREKSDENNTYSSDVKSVKSVDQVVVSVDDRPSYGVNAKDKHEKGRRSSFDVRCKYRQEPSQKRFYDDRLRNQRDANKKPSGDFRRKEHLQNLSFHKQTEDRNCCVPGQSTGSAKEGIFPVTYWEPKLEGFVEDWSNDMIDIQAVLRQIDEQSPESQIKSCTQDVKQKVSQLDCSRLEICPAKTNDKITSLEAKVGRGSPECLSLLGTASVGDKTSISKSIRSGSEDLKGAEDESGIGKDNWSSEAPVTFSLGDGEEDEGRKGYVSGTDSEYFDVDSLECSQKDATLTPQAVDDTTGMADGSKSNIESDRKDFVQQAESAPSTRSTLSSGEEKVLGDVESMKSFGSLDQVDDSVDVLYELLSPGILNSDTTPSYPPSDLPLDTSFPGTVETDSASSSPIIRKNTEVAQEGKNCGYKQGTGTKVLNQPGPCGKVNSAEQKESCPAPPGYQACHPRNWSAISDFNQLSQTYHQYTNYLGEFSHKHWKGEKQAVHNIDGGGDCVSQGDKLHKGSYPSRDFGVLDKVYKCRIGFDIEDSKEKGCNYGRHKSRTSIHGEGIAAQKQDRSKDLKVNSFENLRKTEAEINAPEGIRSAIITRSDETLQTKQAQLQAYQRQTTAAHLRRHLPGKSGGKKSDERPGPSGRFTQKAESHIETSVQYEGDCDIYHYNNLQNGPGTDYPYPRCTCNPEHVYYWMWRSCLCSAGLQPRLCDFGSCGPSPYQLPYMYPQVPNLTSPPPTGSYCHPSLPPFHLEACRSSQYYCSHRGPVYGGSTTMDVSPRKPCEFNDKLEKMHRGICDEDLNKESKSKRILTEKELNVEASGHLSKHVHLDSDSNDNNSGKNFYFDKAGDMGTKHDKKSHKCATESQSICLNKGKKSDKNEMIHDKDGKDIDCDEEIASHALLEDIPSHSMMEDGFYPSRCRPPWSYHYPDYYPAPFATEIPKWRRPWRFSSPFSACEPFGRKRDPRPSLAKEWPEPRAEREEGFGIRRRGPPRTQRPLRFPISGSEFRQQSPLQQPPPQRFQFPPPCHTPPDLSTTPPLTATPPPLLLQFQSSTGKSHKPGSEKSMSDCTFPPPPPSEKIRDYFPSAPASSPSFPWMVSPPRSALLPSIVRESPGLSMSSKSSEAGNSVSGTSLSKSTKSAEVCPFFESTKPGTEKASLPKSVEAPRSFEAVKPSHSSCSKSTEPSSHAISSTLSTACEQTLTVSVSMKTCEHKSPQKAAVVEKYRYSPLKISACRLVDYGLSEESDSSASNDADAAKIAMLKFGKKNSSDDDVSPVALKKKFKGDKGAEVQTSLMDKYTEEDDVRLNRDGVPFYVPPFRRTSLVTGTDVKTCRNQSIKSSASEPELQKKVLSASAPIKFTLEPSEKGSSVISSISSREDDLEEGKRVRELEDGELFDEDIPVISQESYTFPSLDSSYYTPLPPFPNSPFWGMYLTDDNSALSTKAKVIPNWLRAQSQSTIPSYLNRSETDLYRSAAETAQSHRSHSQSPLVSRKRRSLYLPADSDSDSSSYRANWKAEFKDRCSGYGYSYIDTHCHLDFLFSRSGFKGSWTQYMSDNSETFPATFEGCVAVFCAPGSFKADGLWKKVAEEKNVWLAMGCHPKMATDFTSAAEHGLMKCLEHEKVVALGEIGLDYSGTFRQHETVQKAVLRRQIHIALVFKKPLVIHCRDAEDDCLEILKELVPKDYKIHCHCFTSAYSNAQLWFDAFPNLYMGLTPLVTFPTAKPSHDLARHIPLSRLLLETDAPYFIPRLVPKDAMLFSHPGMAITVAEEVAKYQGIPVSLVLRVCRQNTREMYGI